MDNYFLLVTKKTSSRAVVASVLYKIRAKYLACNRGVIYLAVDTAK